MKLTYIQQSGSPPVGDGGDQYPGWDRFGRVVDQRWLKVSSGADLERVQYGFDRGSNRLWRKNVVAGTGQDEVYGYDGLNQVESLQRGTLNATKTGISGTPAWEEDFSFDPTGNWNNYVNQVSGTTTLNQPRTHNAANEILTISGSSALMVQDGAGNLIKAPKVSDWTSANVMIYDGWNRLVKVLDGGTVVGEYGYDGQNRRVTKATGTTTRHYYYSSPWQIVEERLGSVTTAERQFVWGLMDLDNLVLRDRGSERLYGLQDVFNSTAVVDAGGAVQERYGYNAFGLSRVMDASFNPRSVSSFDWETRYACYRFDSESNFYQVRNRYLHPNLGRWLSRDPIGYRAGINLYAYVSNIPINTTDSLGLDQDVGGMKDLVFANLFAGSDYTEELWMCILARESYRNKKFKKSVNATSGAAGYSQLLKSTTEAITESIAKYQKWYRALQDPLHNKNFAKWWNAHPDQAARIPFGINAYTPGSFDFDLAPNQSLYNGIKTNDDTDLSAGGWYLQDCWNKKGGNKAAAVKCYGDGSDGYANAVLNCECCLLSTSDLKNWEKVFDKIHTSMMEKEKYKGCPIKF